MRTLISTPRQRRIKPYIYLLTWNAVVLLTFCFGHAVSSLAQETKDGNPNIDAKSSTRPIFALAGDSTVTDHAGWGLGFQALLRPEVSCINFAQGGRSSRSFRTEGFWQKCLDAKPRYLLIQFGHNDQPGKGPARESAADGDFRLHLSQFIEEARKHDIVPILVTSLTRRRWTAEGKIEESLREYAEATRFVAATEQATLIDLHQLSIEQCEQIGPTAFRAFEPMTEKGADHTHLNKDGSLAVANLVVAELIKALPELIEHFDLTKLKDWKVPRIIPDSLRTSSLSIENRSDTITVYANGKTILCYNKVSPAAPQGIDKIYQRSGFLHPVMTPKGKTVTAAFPFDHAHQQGIFSAWVSTTWNEHEIDFWNLAKGSGRVLHQNVNQIFQEGDCIGFEVDLVHRMEKPHVVDILKETWKITVNPPSDQHHSFDLHSKQTLLTTLPLHINRFHYGGFAVRGPVAWLTPPDPDKLQNWPKVVGCKISNEYTTDRIEGNHMPTRWVSMTGQIDGAPACITMMCSDSTSPDGMTARLHPSKPYFCFAPCIETDFKITDEEPHASHYRFLITDKAPETEWIKKQWIGWQASIHSAN
jgi:lysophospholipase L1-like esterase